jgi:hypothetical protein
MSVDAIVGVGLFGGFRASAVRKMDLERWTVAGREPFRRDSRDCCNRAPLPERPGAVYGFECRFFGPCV